MNDVSRRTWLKAIAGISILPSAATAQPAPSLSVVRSRVDRTGVPHNAAIANSHIDFKVLTGDTRGGVFIIENRDLTPGGPPGHLHYSQEEWFYLVDGGELRMEIGDQKLTLHPGDSVLAPRNVPHVWAYVGA